MTKYARASIWASTLPTMPRNTMTRPRMTAHHGQCTSRGMSGRLNLSIISPTAKNNIRPRKDRPYTPESTEVSPLRNTTRLEATTKKLKSWMWLVPRQFSCSSTWGRMRSIASRFIKPFTPTYAVSTAPLSTTKASRHTHTCRMWPMDTPPTAPIQSPTFPPMSASSVSFLWAMSATLNTHSESALMIGLNAVTPSHMLRRLLR
mmetsp:Transcript_763/g.1392  ORF Transcript_763/g.1392 Transcript_763/m.1392 type:complete len:204 (+) Transcript_763:733-1344(+)